MSSRAYLTHMKIDRFGALENVTVGPFSDGLNVVYGRNEAGKTTVASFAAGVMFGWEDARSQRNTYKPDQAERAGSLLFATEEGDEYRVFRTRNADGLQGDAFLVEDIDKATFKTMFALTSDELHDLRNAPDVTARLLTAGSGTDVSPAQALAETQRRLAEYTSKAASVEHSLVQLNVRRDELRARLRETAQEMSEFRNYDRELQQLFLRRGEVSDRVAQLSVHIEELHACKAELREVKTELGRLQVECDDLHDEEVRALADKKAAERAVGRSFARMTQTQDREIRDKLDDLAAKQDRSLRALEAARECANSSKAAYEVCVEASASSSARFPRLSFLLLAAAALCAVVALGVFSLGAPSNVVTAVVCASGICACVLGCCGAVVALRSNSATAAYKQRVDELRFAMQRDERKLELVSQENESVCQSVRETLDDLGLFEACGSVRQAGAILDEAREVRATATLCMQRQQTASMRIEAVGRRIEQLEKRRAEIVSRIEELGADELGIDAAVEGKSRERTALMEDLESLSARHGKLAQMLAQARTRTDFDALKIEYQAVRTRVNDATEDLVRLLLAEHLLKEAIAAWEVHSQPEVYRQASRLLALMTNDAWVRVALSAEGTLQVEDAARNVRDPLHLSTATRQQLFLSMRIALLMMAHNVGRSIPVFADDILVHFDAARRSGAARALAELASVRQVVLFTCHKDVEKALLDACPAANVIEL